LTNLLLDSILLSKTIAGYTRFGLGQCGVVKLIGLSIFVLTVEFSKINSSFRVTPGCVPSFSSVTCTKIATLAAVVQVVEVSPEEIYVGATRGIEERSIVITFSFVLILVEGLKNAVPIVVSVVSILFG
jgi:hypothetical protein